MVLLGNGTVAQEVGTMVYALEFSGTIIVRVHEGSPTLDFQWLQVLMVHDGASK